MAVCLEQPGRTQIPIAMTTIDGRARETAWLNSRLYRADVRLVTLVGPGARLVSPAGRPRARRPSGGCNAALPGHTKLPVRGSPVARSDAGSPGGDSAPGRHRSEFAGKLCALVDQSQCQTASINNRPVGRCSNFGACRHPDHRHARKLAIEQC